MEHSHRKQRPIPAMRDWLASDKVRGPAAATKRVLALSWHVDRRLFALMVASVVIQSMTPSGQVVLTGRLVDSLIAYVGGGSSVSRSSIYLLVGLQVGLLIIGSTSQFLITLAQQNIGEKISVVIHKDIVRHAGTLDLAAFEDASYYDQLQQAEQEASSRPGALLLTSMSVIGAVITFVSLFAVVLSVSPVVAVLVLIAPIPAVISSVKYSWMQFHLMKWQSPMRRMMTYIASVMTSDGPAKEVRVFGSQETLAARFNDIADKYLAEHLRLVNRRLVAGFTWGLVTIASYAVVLGYVVVLALRGTISPGSVIATTQAAVEVQSTFQAWLSSIQALQENGLYLSSVTQLLERTAAMAAQSPVVGVETGKWQRIEFHHVDFSYPLSENSAVEDVNLVICRGDRIALVGENGAGKSTIVKLLLRLYHPTQGSITIDGVNLRHVDPESYRSLVGTIFQDFTKYQLTLAENVSLGEPKVVQGEGAIRDAVSLAGAAHIPARLPLGYDGVLGRWFQGGTELSGGEWQRVALARSFVGHRDVLVLDEPASALDPVAEHRLYETLNQHFADQTIVYVTHRMNVARKASTIVVFDSGHIAECGSHQELIERGGAYAEMYNEQFRSYQGD